jgi:hypothetical protein
MSEELIYCERHCSWRDQGTKCKKCVANYPPHLRGIGEVMKDSERWKELKKKGLLK